MLVTAGNAGGVGSTVAGIARVPFQVGIDRYLPAAFGKIHPRWKTPYISILVQAVALRRHPAGEPDQRIHARRLSGPDRRGHHSLLHSVPLHVCRGHQARSPRRPRRESARGAGSRRQWPACGSAAALGFSSCWSASSVSLVPPGDSSNKWLLRMQGRCRDRCFHPDRLDPLLARRKGEIELGRRSVGADRPTGLATVNRIVESASQRLPSPAYSVGSNSTRFRPFRFAS